MAAGLDVLQVSQPAVSKHLRVDAWLEPYRALWACSLDQLERHLDGDAPAEDSSAAWRRVHGAYIEQFGPEASTIGPPLSATA